MVQPAPVAKVAGQLFVWEKSPLTEMPEMLRAASPVLLRVTACAALAVFTIWAAKFSDDGDMPATGATPVPLRATAGAAIKLLLLRTREPPRAPRAVGTNETFIWQLALTASDEPQLLVCE